MKTSEAIRKLEKAKAEIEAAIDNLHRGTHGGEDLCLASCILDLVYGKAVGHEIEED